MKIYTVSLSNSKNPIKELDAEESLNTPGMMVVRKSFPNGSRYLLRQGRDWFRTREAAVIAAQQTRLKKLASLRKQIERLEKMEIQ